MLNFVLMSVQVRGLLLDVTQQLGYRQASCHATFNPKPGKIYKRTLAHFGNNTTFGNMDGVIDWSW